VDTGTVFGLSGLLVAMVSLVYVRTQTAASRMQAEASAEQTRITRRIASLEASLRLEDRAFELRREMGDHPAFLEAYFRASSQLQQAIDRGGGFQTVTIIRHMIDTTQDIHLLRREGVVTDEFCRAVARGETPPDPGGGRTATV
jgi:hypothetical protein